MDRILIAPAALLAGCAAPLPGEPPAPGPRVRLDGSTGPTGHAREVAIDGDLVFVADANGLPIVRWSAPEALELVYPLTAARVAHCSSVALHASSRTLLCTSADRGLDALIDVSDPRWPAARPWPAFEMPDLIYAVPDVVIDGDVAWLAAYDDGLVRAPLGPDGTPTALERVPSGTGVLAVALLGERLVYLDRDEGLVVLDRATLERLGSAPIAGPPIGLVAAEDQLLVSMGSEGVASYALDASGAPVLEQTLVPRCVVTDADRRGDALAVACLSGVMLYDLRGAAPRLSRYLPADYGVLDVALTERGLLVVDWYELEVHPIDLDGVPTVPEAPRAMRLSPGAGAEVPLRNPGEAPLEVRFRVIHRGSTRMDGVLSLGPGETQTVAVPASAIAPDADLVIEGGGLRSTTHLRHRSEADLPSEGDVAIGDPFPVLRRVSPSPAPEVLPPSGEPSLVVFLTVDCYLQWPQLEDMAWLRAHGGSIAAPTVFFLTTRNEDPFDPSDHLRRFGALDLRVVEWADYQGAVPSVADEPVPSFAFDRSFAMPLPGADFPHDYHVDAAGVTTATSRTYRGRWPLGE